MRNRDSEALAFPSSLCALSFRLFQPHQLAPPLIFPATTAGHHAPPTAKHREPLLLASSCNGQGSDVSLSLSLSQAPAKAKAITYCNIPKPTLFHVKINNPPNACCSVSEVFVFEVLIALTCVLSLLP